MQDFAVRLALWPLTFLLDKAIKSALRNIPSEEEMEALIAEGLPTP